MNGYPLRSVAMMFALGVFLGVSAQKYRDIPAAVPKPVLPQLKGEVMGATVLDEGESGERLLISIRRSDGVWNGVVVPVSSVVRE